jgi:hypothetical protein
MEGACVAHRLFFAQNPSHRPPRVTFKMQKRELPITTNRVALRALSALSTSVAAPSSPPRPPVS